MFMRKMKKKKAEEEKPKVPEGGDGEFKFKLKDEEFGGPGAGMGMDMDMDMGPPPTSPGADKPGTPPGDVGASGDKPGDSVPKGDVGTVPPQITTCPKCSTVMTFSPDGGMFCIRCGFRPDKEK
jgi:hypothetical protein